MKTSTDTTMELTRVLSVPRAAVFSAWTDPSVLKQWWGPPDVQTHEIILETRPGGQFRWALSAPDGERLTAKGSVRDVRQNERIVFTWSFPDDEDWKDIESLVTVEFRARSSFTTELHLIQENLPSEESRERHRQGWSNAIDGLERLLSR